MSSNSTQSTSYNEGLLTAVSIGGFIGLLFICSCIGILNGCLPICYEENTPKTTQPVPVNPLNAVVDEDPS
jgi:hypothetical protein